MKNIKYILGIAVMSLASCSVEAPFEGGTTAGAGQLSKAALNLDASLVNTKATSDDILQDFDIEIRKSGSSSHSYKAKYKDMPDVVSLNAATYKAYASYGEDVNAKFDSPYYLGESDEFDIVADKITTDIGTIKCKLQNIKVTVNFHSSLYNEIDEKAYVEVNVHKNEAFALKYSKDEERAGYFRHSDECTLVATFHGKIDGVELTEVKTLDNVSGGNHYNLTFSKHTYSEDSENGEVGANIGVSASVTIVNMNENITIAEDEILNDNERPKEEDPSKEPDPDDPEDPGDEDPGEPGEEIYPDGPQASLDKESTVILGKEVTNYINENTKVILNIHSNAGIDEFYVEVESESLDLESLGAEGGVLNLIEPGDMSELLHNLELMPSDVDSFKGYHDVKFDISGFMSLLMLLGEDTHLFKITIKDRDNTEVIYLNLTYDISKI